MNATRISKQRRCDDGKSHNINNIFSLSVSLLFIQSSLSVWFLWLWTVNRKKKFIAAPHIENSIKNIFAHVKCKYLPHCNWHHLHGVLFTLLTWLAWRFALTNVSKLMSIYSYSLSRFPSTRLIFFKSIKVKFCFDVKLKCMAWCEIRTESEME